MAVGAEGIAKVYQKVGRDWQLFGEPIFGPPSFGASVCLSQFGDLFVSSAPEQNKVFVYILQEGSWIALPEPIECADCDDDAMFGLSMDISDNGFRLAVGGPMQNNATGIVRLYQLVGTKMAQIGQTLEGEAGFNEFGFSIDFSPSGDKIAVGAPKYSGRIGRQVGRVYAYQLSEGDETAWDQISFPLDGELEFSEYGFAVSMDENQIAVGAPGSVNRAKTSRAGKIRVYQLISNTFRLLGQVVEGQEENEMFGQSVALDGKVLLIGSPDHGNNQGVVRAYVLDLTSNIWNKI